MWNFSFSYTAISSVVENPSLALSHLNAMLRLSPVGLQKFADTLITSLPLLLGDGIPRKVLDLVQRVWFKCHALTPRRYTIRICRAAIELTNICDFTPTFHFFFSLFFLLFVLV